MAESVSSITDLVQHFLALEDPVTSVTDQEQQLWLQFTRQAAQLREILQAQKPLPFHRYAEYAKGLDKRVMAPILTESRNQEEWAQLFDRIFEDGQVEAREIDDVEHRLNTQRDQLNLWQERVQNSFTRIPKILWQTEFVGFNGSPFQLSEIPQTERLLVSYFFKNCGPCRAEIREAVERAEQNPNFRAVFINIREQDSGQQILADFAESGVYSDHLPPNIHFVHEREDTYAQIMPPNIVVAPFTLVIDVQEKRILTSRVGYDKNLLSDWFE